MHWTMNMTKVGYVILELETLKSIKRIILVVENESEFYPY
jgi:hypothetical protein